MENNVYPKNLDYLLRTFNLTKANIEKDSDVSPGTVNRIIKDSTLNSPALSIALILAKKCNVSLDSLFYLDYSCLTPSEKYYADFINKIIQKTIAGDLVWQKETEKKLNDWSIKSEHPLFAGCDYNGYDPTDYCYHSLFDSTAKLVSDLYNVEIEDAKLYLASVCTDNDPFAYEMYFVKKYIEGGLPQYETIKVCHIESNSPLSKLVNSLESTAKESANHIKIEDQARDIIDKFMIPF